jgi:hypothetical protein
MIHEAYSTSYIAKRYYEKATGESLDKKDAYNRWRMLRHPDKTILKKVIDEIYKEQKKDL